MQLISLLLSLGLSSLALAAPTPRLPDPKAGDKITASLGKVGAAIDGLDTAVKVIDSPQPSAFLPLADKGTAVPTTIKIAQAEIEGAGEVTLIGAAKVADTGMQMMAKFNTLADDLVIKAPIIKAAGLAPVLVQQFDAQGASAMGLMTAVIKSLPAVAQPAAEDAIKQMPNPLDKVKLALLSP